MAADQRVTAVSEAVGWVRPQQAGSLSPAPGRVPPSAASPAPVRQRGGSLHGPERPPWGPEVPGGRLLHVAAFPSWFPTAGDAPGGTNLCVDFGISRP